MVVDFELDGQAYSAINGGPQFTFSEAVSLLVNCDGQEEVDHYWSALTAGGGHEVQCGWLKDRFGFSWQVFPAQAAALLSDPDQERADRAVAAMMQMVKIDLAALRAAADGA
jgi:predicted 3-demethylubiquinone-9 3-methyltransferase (glyoxalase superfamily)